MVSRVFSYAFHTTHQYQLATAFPDIQWYFVDDVWGRHRPMPPNVHMDREGLDAADFDVFLAHYPAQYELMRTWLEANGIPIHRLIYQCHQGYQVDSWPDLSPNRTLDEFVKWISNNPIMCVSHYMVPQYGFYSHQICEVIPHLVPTDLFAPPDWDPGGESYVNVVNNFYAPYRGVGAEFWDTLAEIPTTLYGADNRPTDGGQLRTVQDFKSAIRGARAFLWTANAVAISFAPLEAMACGCPVIAPDNLDWSKLFIPGKEILLYTPNNKDSLLKVIREFEASPRLQRSVAAGGYTAVKSRFSLAIYRRKWERLLAEAARFD